MYADNELAAPPDGWDNSEATFSPRILTPRIAEYLRMVADWQIRQRGYDPAEVVRVCMENDAR